MTSYTTPATIRSSTTAPIDTAKYGRPSAKLAVPSIGSTYHSTAPSP